MLPRLQPKSLRLKSGPRTTACTGPPSALTSSLTSASSRRSRITLGAWSQRLFPNAFDSKRMQRAQEAYSALIQQIQSQGYPVETYTLPYGPVEQMVHTTVLDRMLGTVDVKGDENDLMIYTSYARPVGSAIILDLGPDAQGIIVGITDGPPPAGSGSGPLDWDEFSSDLIVASHLSHHIGVYNLEGCVRQGFLPRLSDFNWSGSAIIPAESVSRAERLGVILRVVLWIASNLIYFIVAGLMFILWFVLRRRAARKHASASV